MKSDELIFICILIIAGIVFLSMILRELYCWYWKINERLDEQRKTNELLGILVKEISKREAA